MAILTSMLWQLPAYAATNGDSVGGYIHGSNAQSGVSV